MKHFMKLTAVSAALMVGAPLMAAHYASIRSLAASGTSLAFAQALNITPQAADAIAVAKVGAGTVSKTSLDTYHGTQVYDIHLQSHTKIWDVKVSVSTGRVVMANWAQEQQTLKPSSTLKSDSKTSTKPSSKSVDTTTTLTPTTTTLTTSIPPTTPTISSTAADTIALQAVGGGTIQHTSHDTYQGTAVYDIHVLYNGVVYDVKVSQSVGTVLLNKVSPESQPSPSSSTSETSRTSPDAPDTTTAPPVVTTTPIGGIVFNQKLSTVPAAYQSDVASAIAQVGGGSLKWVKFITKSSGDIEMNIKIHLAAKGTIKVKDVFSPSGQLLSQSLNS